MLMKQISFGKINCNFSILCTTKAQTLENYGLKFVYITMEDDEDVWRTPPWLYPCILLTSAALIFYRSRILSKEKEKSSPFLPLSLPPSFVFFQRRFLAVFLLALAAEDLQIVFGEAFLEHKGFNRHDIALYLLTAELACLSMGPILGILADRIGRKKACLLYCLIQISGVLLKQTKSDSLVWSASIFQGLATSLLSCAFESWLVIEHEKTGFRQEWIFDTFWLMSFGAAVVAIGAAGFANFLVARTSIGIVAPSIVSAVGAGLAAVCVLAFWDENPIPSHVTILGMMRSTFHIVYDKKVMTLGWCHASLDFANTVFWYLWTPTLVADGRGLHAGMLFPTFMAAEMLGSAVSAGVMSGPWNVNPEDILRWIFISAAFAFTVPAYDYQEIEVLVFVFCVFHVCYGISWPLLARLRSLYISSEHRTATMALFRVPANAAVIFILVNGSMYQRLDNNKIFGISVAGLMLGAYCMHVLHRSRLQPYEKFSTERP